MAKTKTSFPQHMRNAQKALDAFLDGLDFLAAEFKRYDPKSRDWVVEYTRHDDFDSGGYVATATHVDRRLGYVESTVLSSHPCKTVDDAATALLHAIAGTEEAPF